MSPELIALALKGGLAGICILTIVLGWKRELRTAKDQRMREEAHQEREKRNAQAFAELNNRSHEIHLKTVENLSTLNANLRAFQEEIRQRPCIDEWDGRERRKT